MRGEPVASVVRDSVDDRVQALRDRGVEPTLGIVLMSDSPAQRRFMELKRDAGTALGIGVRDRQVPPDAHQGALAAAVGDLSEDPAVDAVFVQTPLPEGADVAAARRRIAPAKDVDCFHPDSLGRLVAGDPRYVPATTAAVRRLLEHYGIRVAGRRVAVVGRTTTIGKPLTNHLLRRGDPGDATVTVCHSRTADLAAHTRRADVVVTACGRPELVDADMLSAGVAVVDVSANRQVVDGEPVVLGDVDFEAAGEVARAITPVPGGVGPVTIAMLLRNVVTAVERRADQRSSP